MFYVYYLIDPRNNEVFYIGKGTGNRMYYHENQILKGKKIKHSFAKFDRIREILEEGYEVIKTKVFETDDESLAYAKEAEHIKSFGIENLTNLRIDWNHKSISQLVSDGLKKSKKFKKAIEYKRSPKGREKYRILNLGKSNPMFGKKLSLDHKKALIEGASKPSTDEHRKNISEALKGLKKTEEHRKNISDGLKNSEKFKKAITSPEYIEKQRKNSLGSNNPNAKTYRFISPEGKEFQIKGTFDTFCKEHNLNVNSMRRIARDMAKNKFHQGWTVIEIK